jgi:hypothetical protein
MDSDAGWAWGHLVCFSKWSLINSGEEATTPINPGIGVP